MSSIDIIEVNGEHITYSITKGVDKTKIGYLDCVFEIFTEGDMSIYNPWDRRRLWVASGLVQDTNIYDAMTRVIAVAKELKFLGDPDEN
jgi:hypothetical protein